MAIEAFTALVYGFAVGIAGGALSAYLGWNKSGEPFDTRKFISGVITGVIAGVIVVLANTAALTTAADQTALLVTLATVFIAIIGVDTIRTAITGSIRNARQEKAKEYS